MKKRFYEAWNNERFDNMTEDWYERLSEVDGWNKFVWVKCKKCGNTFEVTPNSVVQDHRCKFCAREARKGQPKKAKYTLSEARNAFRENGFELLDDMYIKNSIPMAVRCTKCGDIGYKRLRNVLAGQNRCKTCEAKEAMEKARQDGHYETNQVKINIQGDVHLHGGVQLDEMQMQTANGVNNNKGAGI